MIVRSLKSLALITLISLPVAGAIAGDFAEENGVALKRFDPVAYFVRDHQPALGVRELSTVYKDSKFYFLTKSDMEAFIANPEHYAPQFGGYCAYNAALGSKVAGSPRIFAVVDDKLYLFSSFTAMKDWKKDVGGNLARATEAWPTVTQRVAQADK
jgi:hypothetical protein